MKIRINGEFMMRLHNIHRICKDNIVTCKKFKLSHEGSNMYYLENWTDYKNSLFQLTKIDALKDVVVSLYNSVDRFSVNEKKPQLSQENVNRMPQLNNQLVVKMETIISLYESLELKSSGIGIDVKVPKCNDLKEYISNLREIEFIFSQCPYLKNKNEQTKFNSVDVGSQWLTFIIELSAAVSETTFSVSYVLKNFAILVDKVFVLKSHFLTVKEQQKNLNYTKRKMSCWNQR